MDVQDNVVAVVGRHSASPDQPVAEPGGVQSAMTGTPNGITSSPPTLPQDIPMGLDHPASVEDGGEKSDSDAETIVLPGKEGHSPSRVRKSIKHEDKSEDEEMTDAPDIQDLAELDEERVLLADKAPSESTIATSLGKRKRTKNRTSRDDTAHLGNSSGLSSVPTSPVATTRSSLSKPAASDSDVSKSPSPPPRSTIRDKAKSVDRLLPRKRQYASGSGDEDEAEAEAESQSFARQRNSGTDHKSNRDGRSSSKLNVDNASQKRTRSISPHPRGHRRSISTQLPSKSAHGLSHKKKRVPAPLQATDYHSDDSSASGNSHPRSSRLRNLAAPTTGDSAISPAKMPPHKKHVNSSGQTLLAIACSRGKLDVVKQRYEERPEDVNLADNALNTPLHIASLEGFVDIVQFLIDTGSCELDAVNDLKDTPLHDAVDNKNVEVVKLLLDAGANPSLANTEGNEPLDKINVYGDGDDDADDEDSKEDREKASEMRAAIMAAKQKFTSNVRRGSEDHQMHENGESRLSHPKESPRQTPPAHEAQTSTGRMSGTARRLKTRDSHLWITANPATLQKAASEGNAETISQILNVNPNLNDAKALFNAARGGHDAVINLLFALGNFNPDPAPLEGVQVEQSTPILAAIGKDNHLEVIKLFLGHPDFDPTRRLKGETYYEIAKRRGGPKWQDEEKLLKDAFDAYHKSHKTSLSKPRSPGLRRDARVGERDSKKSARTDDTQSPQSHKRSTSSPKTKESESSKNHHRSNPSLSQSKDGSSLGKRGPGRPRKEENTSTALSDRETSPLGPPKQKSQSKNVGSDTPLSENDPTIKPRRKLMSRGERELEKQRRASIASNASSVSIKEKRERGSSDTKPDKQDGRSSPNIPRTSKGSTSGLSDKELISDKQSSEKDRARSLKRDDSKDRLSAIRGESPVKRPRKSETPPRSNMQEVTSAYGSGGSPQKRRKVDAESVAGHKSEHTPNSSPEHRTTSAKAALSRENTLGKSNAESKIKSSRSGQKPGENSEGSKDSVANDKTSSRQAKSANSTSSSVSDPPPRKPRQSGDRPHKEISDAQSAQVKIEEEEVHRQAQLRREKKEAEAARQKELEEEKEKERIENARQARLAREQAAREEEEKRQRDEAERKARQEKEDAEAHKRAMEEQRILYEQQEKLKKEELERRKAAAIEQQRLERARLEKERREERLAKLPLLLKWFDQASDPQTPEIANLFKRIAGYRYDTIRPEATGQAIGREQWMLNIHVAILLGEKDLQLSRYSDTAWERIPLSHDQKRGVWGTENGMILLKDSLSVLRKQVPSQREPAHEIFKKNELLFLGLDLFFVKISEFMFIVPRFPHLRGVELLVRYMELRIPQTAGMLGMPFIENKWKQDPETPAGQPFAPQPKIYVNGEFVKQAEPQKTRLLKEPPPLDRFPRREGIIRVYPGEPDYEEVCRKQGLFDLLPGYQASPSSSAHPQIDEANQRSEHVNGITPPRSDKSKSVNGGSPHQSAISESISHHLPHFGNASPRTAPS